MDIGENSWRLISGGISGAVSRTCVAPIERVIILKQTNTSQYQKLNLFRCFGLMFKEGGLLSMFRGNGANCLRIAPYQAIEFFIFDKMKKFTQNNTSLLLIGGLSGAIATTTVYPFDLVKTILAVQEGNTRGIFGTLVNLFATKGPSSLFKGLSATLIGISPYSSLKLTFFQNLTGLMSPRFDKDLQNLIFGGLAGCLALSITYPTDVIRRRLQVQVIRDMPRSGYLYMMKLMYKEKGIQVFYQGLFATYAKVIPSTAIAFTINEKLKRHKNLH
ncbi:hypothetical protein pb186bvf_008639 [Paramecium bursaria]